MLDNSTLNDLLGGRAYTGKSDTDFCAQLKALCLLGRATRWAHLLKAGLMFRLFDTASCVSTSERRSHLINITETYMSSLDPVEYGTLGAKVGPKAQAWQMLHLCVLALSAEGTGSDGSATLLLHLKEDIDLPIGSEASGRCVDAAVKSAEQLIQAIEVLYITGDSELRELRFWCKAW